MTKDDDDSCTHCEILNAAASVCEEDDNTAMDAIQNAVKVMDMSTNQEEDYGRCNDCPAADICPTKNEESDTYTPVAKDVDLPN